MKIQGSDVSAKKIDKRYSSRYFELFSIFLKQIQLEVSELFLLKKKIVTSIYLFKMKKKIQLEVSELFFLKKKIAISIYLEKKG